MENKQIFLVTYDHSTTNEDVPDGWGVSGHTDIIGAFSTKKAAQKCINELIGKRKNENHDYISSFTEKLYAITPLVVDAEINYDKPAQNEVGFISYFE